MRIDPINEPPLIDGPAEVFFEESRTGVVARYTTTDPEKRTTAWRLEDNKALHFDFNDGRLSFTMPPDFEAPGDVTGDNAYELIVVSTDGENRAEFPVTVRVTNKDEPGKLKLSSRRPLIGFGLRATLTDSDNVEPGTMWIWERSRSRSGSWTPIDGATELEYEPVAADRDHYLRVTASYADGHGPNKSLAAISDFQTRPDPGTNAAPSFPATSPGDRDLSVPEGTPAGTLVGDPVLASDSDGDPLSYDLSGAHDFVIDGRTGQIRVAPDAMINFERVPVYQARVAATDPRGGFASVQFQIVITDVNEAPVAEDDVADTPEDAAVVVRVLDNDLDPENDDLAVFRVTEPPNGEAEVDGGGQTITYTPNPNYHGADSFAYTVSDTESEVEARVNVIVHPMNDAPAFAAATAERLVSESAPPAANVGLPVTANDVDDDALTYELTGAAASNFEIEEPTGQITVAEGAELDATNQPTHTVTVIARDPSGTEARIEVTITVTAGPVGPPIIVGPTITTGGGPGGGGGGPSGPTPSELDFEWTVTHDLEQLDGGNDWPTGLWSDGENLWLLENGQGADDAVYAYDRASGERAAERVQRHRSARDRARRLGRGPFDSEELVLWNAGRRMGASHTVGRYGTFRHRGRRMRSPQRSRPPLRGVAAVALRSRARTAAVP